MIVKLIVHFNGFLKLIDKFFTKDFIVYANIVYRLEEH